MSAFVQIMSLLMVVCALLLLWGCNTRSMTMPILETPAPLLATLQMPLPFVETFPVVVAPRPAFATTQISGLPQSSTSSIALPTPACYRQAQRVLICLGQVVNTGTEAIDTLRLRLSAGTQSQTISPEQRVIPSGSFAPYRALFTNLNTERATPMVEAASVSDETLLHVTLLDETGVFNAGRSGYGVYAYSAQLSVDEDFNGTWQAIVTLFGDDQQIIGYRVYESNEPLRSSQPLTFTAEVIPLALASRYHATLTVIAG